MKLRLAAIGARHDHCWGLIEELVETGKAELVAFAEDNPKLRREISERFPDLAVHYDWKKCLDEAKPDAVVLTTRNFEKQRVAVECLERRIGVMADKPLFTEREWLERAERMWRRARKKVPLCVAFGLRQSREGFALKQLINKGELGEIAHVYKCRPHRLRPEGRHPWELNTRQNGGPLVDLASHDVDFANWIIGSRPVEVTAYTKMSRFKEYRQFHDNGQMMVRYENGAVLMVEVDWLTPEKSRWHGDCRALVTGSEGFAETFEHRGILRVTTFKKAEREVELPACTFNLSEDFLRQFGGKAKWLTPEEIFLTHRVLIAAGESAQGDGAKVKV